MSKAKPRDTKDTKDTIRDAWAFASSVTSNALSDRVDFHRVETVRDPRCEVHDGDAPAVEQVIWNGRKRWVCRACLDGR